MNSQMMTLMLYDEIEIVKCPLDLFSLKQTIKEKYFLSYTQIEHCLISYNLDDKQHYIFSEEEYQIAKLFIEDIIIKIELLDDNDILTIDPNIDEEYEIYRLKEDKKEEPKINENKKEEYNDNLYDEYDIETFCGEEYMKSEECDGDSNEIRCNLCNNHIQGVRYLCGVCGDFDMCENCEKEEGPKHGHPMLKIRNPDMVPLCFECKLSEGSD